jgi:hypothetical protein
MNCENYTLLYCATPFNCPTCEGCWTCDEIAAVTEEVFADLDENGDG